MKKTNYYIMFTTSPDFKISAFNIVDACILAMAERIKNGCHIRVSHVTNLDTGEKHHFTDLIKIEKLKNLTQ